MTPELPDVNVLVALAWPNHTHHRAAHDWFRERSAAGWATCPFTQAGFVRVSSNPAIIADAVTPREAAAVLARICQRGQHVFWPDDIDLADEAALPMGLVLGHRQVTDAYLLALCRRHGGILATLDHGIRNLAPEDGPYGSSMRLLAAR